MVRAGIALYGLYPSEEVKKQAVKLRPALIMANMVDIQPYALLQNKLWECVFLNYK